MYHVDGDMMTIEYSNLSATIKFLSILSNLFYIYSKIFSGNKIAPYVGK